MHLKSNKRLTRLAISPQRKQQNAAWLHQELPTRLAVQVWIHVHHRCMISPFNRHGHPPPNLSHTGCQIRQTSIRHVSDAICEPMFRPLISPPHHHRVLLFSLSLTNHSRSEKLDNGTSARSNSFTISQRLEVKKMKRGSRRSWKRSTRDTLPHSS